MKKASNIVTYIWKKGKRRPIDILTKILFDLRVIEQYDAIPIKNERDWQPSVVGYPESAYGSFPWYNALRRTKRCTYP